MYTSVDSMISPPAGLSGARGNPITVRALNDGHVLLDGQFMRTPVFLKSNSWWILEGFNARNGAAPGGVLQLVNESNNNIVRRVVVWDSEIHKNTRISGTTGSSGPNLFEDFAAFGTGRKTFSNSQGGNNVTCRRCWFREEGTTSGGPRGVTMYYNNYGMTVENLLATWTGESMPESYTDALGASQTSFKFSAGHGPLASDRIDEVTTPVPGCAKAKVLGSLAYMLVKPGGLPRFNGPSQNVIALVQADCITVRHTIAALDPRWYKFDTVRGFSGGNRHSATPPVTPTHNSAHNITSLVGSVGNSFSPGWDVHNNITGSSLASLNSQNANPWTGTAGANLCKRWVNGQVTTEPLWPWPMNERIKAATAMAGSYSGPCPTCVGGRLARTATDVTAEVETLLGAIPSQCRRSR
jgi:hypothetical protein